ncbi:MAG: beta-lactamase family protein [Deltaproteobacteria bacterium]|nr:beta-lactamase family protein [Deltaproteobacteria bacterium]
MLLLALLACKPDPAADPTGDWADVAAIFAQELEDRQVPAAAVVVRRHGEVLWSQGFGTLSPDHATPVGPDSLFRIGSVTKSLTAVALLQQVDDGLISLDDHLVDQVPDLHFAQDPEWGDAITLRHLLSHQSGLLDYAVFDHGDDALLSSWLTGDYAAHAYLMAPPGAFWNYANPNFSFAGLVAETVDGAPYTDVMGSRVLQPLGLLRTTFDGEQVLSDGDWASGRTVDWNTGEGEVWVTPTAYDSASMRPAGFAWSSAAELSLFTSFLLNGEPAVLSDSARAEMQGPVISTEMMGDTSFYGYGLMFNEGFFLGSRWIDAPLVSHQGAIPGYSADLYLLPEQGASVVVLAAADGAYLSAVADALYALELPEGSAPDLSYDTDFTPFEGTWYDPNNVGTLEVAGEGDTLTVQAPLLDAHHIPYGETLVPITPGNFLWEVQGIQTVVSFILDRDGVDYLRTRYFVATREPAPAPPETALRAWLRGLRAEPRGPVYTSRPPR